MNVLITQRYEQNKNGDWCDVFETNYKNYFKSYGINLIPISNNESNINKFIKEFDISGIILSGGADIIKDKHSERYVLEMYLLILAIAKNIPVLGICSGMHRINQYFGGSLCDNNSFDMQEHKKLGNHIHDITILHPELIDKYNKLPNKPRPFAIDKIKTNSYHNQAISTVIMPDSLKYFAIAVSEVEGLYAEHHPIAGIQWHPERENAPNKLDKILINAFLNKKLFWS